MSNVPYELTKIKHIVLFNSGNYAYFEEDFNQNIIIEGNNNIGKTTVLNSLQLLLLPETNLKDFDHKFSFGTAKDGKKYTSKGTYEFYFPSENSYIIIEVENEGREFCLILHRERVFNNNYEYTRVLADIPYQEIKPLLIKEDGDETRLINTDKPTFLSDLKTLIKNRSLKEGENYIFMTLKNKEEIKNFLYSVRMQGKRNPYCVVPLKDTNPDTIKNFGILFKSLYSIGNMTPEHKRKFVAELIEVMKLRDDQSKTVNLDLKDIIEKNNALLKEREKYELMDNLFEKYEKTIGGFEEWENKKTTLMHWTKSLYEYTKKAIKENEKFTHEYNDKKNTFEKNKTILVENIEHNKDSIQDKNTQIAVLSNENKNIDETYTNISKKLFEIPEFKETNNNNNRLEINGFVDGLKKKTIENFTEDLIPFIDMLEDQIENGKKRKKIVATQLSECQTNKNIQDQRQKTLKDIENLEKKKDKYETLINNKPFYTNPLFTVEEQAVIKTIFKENITMQNEQNITERNLGFFKEFLSIFNKNDNKIKVGNCVINMLDYNQDFKETELLLSVTKDELMLKQETLVSLENSDDDYNQLSTRLSKEIENLNKEENLLEGCVYNLREVPKTNQKYFENTEKIQTLQEEKNNITEQQNLSAEKLRKLEEDFEEEDRKFKSIYAETEGYRKVVEELEDSTKIENVFFENIEDLSYTEDTPPLTISDITQESKELMHSIQKYKELKLNLSRDIFLFQQNHILENIIPIDTRMDTDTAKGEEVMIQCRDGLVKVYSTLEENKRFLLDNIRGHNADIISGVGILLQMEKGIREFEKKINEELAHIQISNLPGVSFDIEVDKRLVKMIQTISNNNEDNPLDTKTLEILSNYIYQKTKQQNQIGIIDLIETVDYSILSTNKRTGEIEKIKDIQSNGTQTMINLIFVTILFNSSFKENRKLQLIIPLDEASNIDQFNVKTLITVMGERGCKIVAATPLATPEHLNIFDRSITIDQKQVKEMLSKNARYLVLINQNIFNIFYQNKFIEMED